MRPVKRGAVARPGPVADAALDRQQLLDALVANRGLRHRVGQLREIAHRLVHLAQIQHEDDQDARAHPAREGEPRAVAEHQAGAERDDDFDDGSEPGFGAASGEARLDLLAALRAEPPVFVVLARIGLHDMNRREDLGHVRQQLALLLSYGARGLLDAPRVDVHDQEERRRNRKREQRESPVVVQHDADHAGERQDVDQDAEQRRADEILNGPDVARHPGEQIALVRLAVLGERQALDLLVQEPPQVVAHPLADAGGQVFLPIRAEGANHGDAGDGGDGEVQRRRRTST